MRTIPEQALQDYETLYDVERSKLHRALKDELQQQQAQLIGRGLGQSGSMVRALTRAGTMSFPLRAQTALTLVLRVFSAHGVSLTREAAGEADRLLTDTLAGERVEIIAVVADYAGFTNQPAAKTYGREVLDEEMNETHRLELNRVRAELSLAVAANSRATEGAAPGMVINGPVGLLQTGPGSFGVAHQHIDAGAAAQLTTALEAIVAILKDDESAEGRELLEMVTDTQDELKKPQPNTSKVRGFVTALGSAIAYVPKLRQAYDTLKWAAAFVGVHLP